MKRSRTRCVGDISEEVTALSAEVIDVCAGGGTAGVTQDKVSSLQDEVEGTGHDSVTKEVERRLLSRLAAYERALRNVRRHDSTNTTTANASTQTTESQSTREVPAKKKLRLSQDDEVKPPPSPGFGPGSPLVVPGSPGGGAVLPVASMFPAVLPVVGGSNVSGLGLGETDMVRIAADFVFSIMRVAQVGPSQIRSLSELFVEADASQDGGISFIELLSWVKSALQINVSDWQLDEFGRRLQWDKICESHPKKYIDEKGFYRIISGVWNKVKWYFSNAVVYGVTLRDTQKKRHKEVLAIMEDIREPMQMLIHCLVVRSCHIHSFFAVFDQERTQNITAVDLAKIFLMLGPLIGVKDEKAAQDLSLKCCLIANYFCNDKAKESSSGLKFDSSSSGSLQRGDTYHYAAMCALTRASDGAESEGSGLLRQPTLVVPGAMSEPSQEFPDDVKMARPPSFTEQGITQTISDLSISLFQLQDLVLEFFTEFSMRMELNVLAAESRDKMVFRHLFFGVCGVFEASQELKPIANIFTLFSKYASQESGLLSPYGFQELLKNEFAVTVTEKEIVALLSISDLDRDNLLGVTELAALLRMAQTEIRGSVKRRFPSNFKPSQTTTLLAHKRAAEVTATFAKVVLKVLHTDETFSEFFQTLPKFRPAELSFGCTNEQSRYPDELVLGLRRVGVITTPEMFENLGVHGAGWTGTRWGPAPSYVTEQQFLEFVWLVYCSHIEPAFEIALDFDAEAREVKQSSLQCLYKFISGSSLEAIWVKLESAGTPTAGLLLKLLAQAEAAGCAGEELIRTISTPPGITVHGERSTSLHRGLTQFLLLSGLNLDEALTKEKFGRLWA